MELNALFWLLLLTILIVALLFTINLFLLEAVRFVASASRVLPVRPLGDPSAVLEPVKNISKRSTDSKKAFSGSQ